MRLPTSHVYLRATWRAFLRMAVRACVHQPARLHAQACSTCAFHACFMMITPMICCLLFWEISHRTGAHVQKTRRSTAKPPHVAKRDRQIERDSNGLVNVLRNLFLPSAALSLEVDGRGYNPPSVSVHTRSDVTTWKKTNAPEREKHTQT